jgi:1-deoxy-D-xylulose-5-phosphate reductoisomerase
MDYISPLPSPALRQQWPRSLSILGCTGSIGCSALEFLRLHPEAFRIAALGGGRNLPLLARQAAEFRPPLLGILDATDVPALRSLLPAGYHPEIVAGPEGYRAIAALPEAPFVLSAQSGAAGLRGTFTAVERGKVVALANKESLVLAGGLIRKRCAETGASILPVDSEHNAIFQCLADSFPLADAAGSRPQKRVRRLILTASGGPFYGRSPEELAGVTVEQALAHPNWNMGAKITIDSATLMNKGLEVMEAQHLYGLPLSAIEVLVHRESIIHSLVEFADGSQLAQLSNPDMRVPIAHCLAWPERLETGARRLDLAEQASLSFSRPDAGAFPCLGLARRAQEAAAGVPVVLNAANEEAVAAFLGKRIGFMDIPRLVARALDDYEAGRFGEYGPPREPDSVEAIMALDEETRARLR